MNVIPLAAPTPCRKPGCPTACHDAYCTAHADEAKALAINYEARRGSSARRGYGYTWRTRTRLRILRRDPFCRCSLVDCPIHKGRAACARTATEVDHVVPKARGGGEGDDNLQGLCHECHSRKTALEDGGFGH